MLIKIVQNGIESDWFKLTKKAHRELIKMKPEAAIIHIEDVYPESPDAGRVIRLDFRLFTVLTRVFPFCLLSPLALLAWLEWMTVLPALRQSVSDRC